MSEAEDAIRVALHHSIYVKAWVSREDVPDSVIANIITDLARSGYDLVKRDPFTSVGLTPPVPVEDLDRAGKLAERVSELESALVNVVSKLEYWIDRHSPVDVGGIERGGDGV